MPLPLTASTVMSVGTPMTGGVASNGAMLTWNWPEEVLPRPSFAVQVTVVGPTGNVVPEAGAQLTDTDWPRSVAAGVV